MKTSSIHWFRLDLRLTDNPALQAAVARGAPVVPVFIWAPEEEGAWPPGGASKWWLHQALAAFENSLAHEQRVTKSIHDIVSLASDEKDYGTVRFLDWFVNEQVEEEASVGDAIARLEMVGDDKAALCFLDRELGARQDEE